jgi:hypothetical protein
MHTSTRPAQQQCGAQSGGATADDNFLEILVVHGCEVHGQAAKVGIGGYTDAGGSRGRAGLRRSLRSISSATVTSRPLGLAVVEVHLSCSSSIIDELSPTLRRRSAARGGTCQTT